MPFSPGFGALKEIMVFLMLQKLSRLSRGPSALRLFLNRIERSSFHRDLASLYVI